MSNIYGMIAEFESAGDLLKAAKAFNKSGFKKFETYSPFPIHGMDKAMGLGQSKLGWIVLLHGMAGLIGAFVLQWWTSVIDYPIIIGGKPIFSFKAYMPVCFELMVLFSAFGAVFGMFKLNGLPEFHHDIFNASIIEKATENGFLLAVEAKDPSFNEDTVKQLFNTTGGQNIEVIKK